MQHIYSCMLVTLKKTKDAEITTMLCLQSHRAVDKQVEV